MWLVKSPPTEEASIGKITCRGSHARDSSIRHITTAREKTVAPTTLTNYQHIHSEIPSWTVRVPLSRTRSSRLFVSLPHTANFIRSLSRLAGQRRQFPTTPTRPLRLPSTSALQDLQPRIQRCLYTHAMVVGL